MSQSIYGTSSRGGQRGTVWPSRHQVVGGFLRSGFAPAVGTGGMTPFGTRRSQAAAVEPFVRGARRASCGGFVSSAAFVVGSGGVDEDDVVAAATPRRRPGRCPAIEDDGGGVGAAMLLGVLRTDGREGGRCRYGALLQW